MAQEPQNQEPEARRHELPPSEQVYSDTPAQDPYSVPPDYNDAPQNPYHVPPRNPYEMPTRERYTRMYESGYGHDEQQSNQGYGWQQPQPGPGYLPPENHPLPLWQAIRELPEQYGNVLTKPSPNTLAGEMTKASWDIVWVQLLISAIASIIFGYLASITSPERYDIPGPNGAPYFNHTIVTILNMVFSFGSIVLVPLSFFISVGLLYWLARAFGGRGTFLRQGYVTLLWDVPLGIISSLAIAIPVLGGLISFAILIYRIVLQVFTVKAVHGLDTGRAVGVVLSLVGIVFLLACAFGVIIAIAYLGTNYSR